MNRLLKVIVLIAQIGGGLMAIGFLGRSLLAEQMPRTTLVVHVAFILVFSFGIVAGVALIRKPGLGLWLSAAFQAMQIPILAGSTAAYALACGASLNLYKHANGWGVNFLFGSRYSFYLGGDQSWVVGVNLVALGLFILLIREIRLQAAAAKLDRSRSLAVPPPDAYSQVEANHMVGSPLRSRL
jgi:hypothetical protein